MCSFLICAHGGKILNKRGDLLGRTYNHTDLHLPTLRVRFYNKWEITDGSKP